MKYVATFTKTGRMIYISHLDLIRVFLRALRMAGLRPEYSNGFNPHPKMGFALPLSLGYHSIADYIEFETLAEFDENNAIQIINSKLPADIRITAFGKKPEKYNKSLASYVFSANYEIMCEGMYNTPNNMEEFFNLDHIFIDKTSKKGKPSVLDIRDRMLSYRIMKDLKNRMLINIDLRSDSERMLNPGVFFNSYCNKFNIDIEPLNPVITRIGIIDNEGNLLV